MAGKGFKIEAREWNRTFPAYMQHTKRDLPTALNSKAFFIARRAVVETPKAKLGRMDRKTAAILGRIINKRRAERGEPGLYGEEMKKAVEILYQIRRRSVAFLKSGWLPAIRRLELAVEAKYRRGAARNDRSAAQVGQPKGKAIPARTGVRTVAIIENAAIAKHDNKDALLKYGGPALQKAFDYEVRSMKEYIERKLKETARRHAIKTG